MVYSLNGGWYFFTLGCKYRMYAIKLEFSKRVIITKIWFWRWLYPCFWRYLCRQFSWSLVNRCSYSEVSRLASVHLSISSNLWRSWKVLVGGLILLSRNDSITSIIVKHASICASIEASIEGSIVLSCWSWVCWLHNSVVLEQSSLFSLIHYQYYKLLYRVGGAE